MIFDEQVHKFKSLIQAFSFFFPFCVTKQLSLYSSAIHDPVGLSEHSSPPTNILVSVPHYDIYY